VGLLVCSSLDGPNVPLPGDLELLGPAWPGQGVFIWLVPPSSPYYNDETDNRLILGIDPLQVGAPVGINDDPEETGTFIVSITLEELEEYLGSYSDSWFYSTVALLRRDDGTELEPAHGGWVDLLDPDIYDVAFVPNARYQRRILGSWIADGDPAGPREVAIRRLDRGVLGLHPDSLTGLPQPGPETQFFSSGARRIWKAFTVTGQVADPGVTSGLFHHRRRTWEIPLQSGAFAVPIELYDGANLTGVTVEDAAGNSSTTWARYDYLADHRPKPRIGVEPTADVVILDGTGSWHPDGLDLVSYQWLEQPGNPAALDLSGVSSQTASFTLPKPLGQYAVKLVVSDGDHTGEAIATVFIDSLGAQQLPYDAHPAWATEDVLYEIYPVAYSSARDLDAITDDLDRIVSLGTRALWLTPICVGNEVHGYAVTDYFFVNQSLGGDAALTRLVEAAHARGIKVILDLVINHTSIEHPFMRDAVRYGPNSVFYDYYLWNPDGTYESYWIDLPNLNYGNPEVWAHFLEVSQYWLEEYHIDGYRCDVAWGIQQRNPAFWQAWRDSLKVINDNLLLLAEASVDDGTLFEDRFDAAYDWELLGLLRDLLRNQETPAAVHQHLLQVPGDGDDPLALRFIENHDETRFIAEFGPDRTRLAATLLYTVPGLPLLYAGQEAGELSQRYYIDWSDPENLQPFYRTLGTVRSSLPSLMSGSYWWIPNDHSTAVYSYSRETSDQRVIVALNCRAFFDTVSISLPVARWGFAEGETWVVSNLLTGENAEYSTEELSTFSLALGPYEFLVAAVADSVVANVVPFPDVPALSLSLLPPSPNPASGPVTVSFTLPANTCIGLDLYDLSGRKQLTILDEKLLPSGRHGLTWNPLSSTHVKAGAYFLVLQSDGHLETRPLVVLR
jgi:cyclomaltodextrinase